MIKDSYRSAAAVLCQPVHFYRLILAGCVSGISFPDIPVRVVLCAPFFSGRSFPVISVASVERSRAAEHIKKRSALYRNAPNIEKSR